MTTYLLPEGFSDTEAVMIEPRPLQSELLQAELCEEGYPSAVGCGAGKHDPKDRETEQGKDHSGRSGEEKLKEALKTARLYDPYRREDVVEKAKELTGGYGPTVSIDAACTKGSLLTLLHATGNAGR